MDTSEYSELVMETLEMRWRCDNIIYLREADWQGTIFPLCREMSRKRDRLVLTLDNGLEFRQETFSNDVGTRLMLYRLSDGQHIDFGLCAILLTVGVRVGIYREHV